MTKHKQRNAFKHYFKSFKLEHLMVVVYREIYKIERNSDAKLRDSVRFFIREWGYFD